MHGEGQALALRWPGAITVARGPVPRDLNCLKQDFQDFTRFTRLSPAQRAVFLQ